MQWRPLVLLVCGVTVIYLTSLLQDVTYPHPIKVYTSDDGRWRHSPDEIMLTIAGGFLYLTAFRFEVDSIGQRGFRLGTGSLKTGVIGHITQLRQPIQNLLQDNITSREHQGWALVFQHELPGAISKVSKSLGSRNGEPNPIQFGAIYHVVENETSRHYARIYYMVEDKFEYKDLRLPGSTWVNAFSLEKDELLVSRQPDRYRFRIISLPPDLTDGPHSHEASEIVISHSVPGAPIGEYRYPRRIESHDTALARVYSPIKDVYRVVMLDMFKTDMDYRVNLTIVDNATAIPEQYGDWFFRDGGMSYDGLLYSEDQIDYIGFSDMSQFQQERQRLNIPRLMFARSDDSQIVEFPFESSRIWSLAYVDQKFKLSTKELKDYYEYLKNEVPGPYDATVMGTSVNGLGNYMAVWTDYNTIYIYHRDLTKETGMRMMQTSDPDEKELFQSVQEWKLSMMITRTEGDLGIKPIRAVHFYNTTVDGQQSNYIFVALDSGAVNSYRIDETEESEEPNFLIYAKRSWSMVSAITRF
ncbi:hypothetical protein BX666DRAFT_2032570 [Dichotomocladium elegans]|nr:hypothetical protein BX666DRAFT_2032570 [Dichotomocladium elegans]